LSEVDLCSLIPPLVHVQGHTVWLIAFALPLLVPFAFVFSGYLTPRSPRFSVSLEAPGLDLCFLTSAPPIFFFFPGMDVRVLIVIPALPRRREARLTWLAAQPRAPCHHDPRSDSTPTKPLLRFPERFPLLSIAALYFFL